jgi:AmmeMemoRadiSam system protein A
MHDAELGRVLVSTARCAIGIELGRPGGPWPDHRSLAAPGATFVTLQKHGELRGCVGSLRAQRALGLDVRMNAIAAAFSDPRFSPLRDDEFGDTSVEVSLLSAPESIASADEDDLLIRLQPGIDGVILEFGGQRATFLPQVWESLPEPRQFLVELKRKAGLPADFWSPAVNVSRYAVTKWREGDFVRAAA